MPGGGASCLGVGRPGLGALPAPTARPLGGLPGSTTHWLWVRGGAGVGTRHQPHSARSCELASRAVGAARGRPGGAPPAWVWGVRGRALSHPRLPVLWAGCRGPLPTGCGCGGVQAWGPVTNLAARALACCGGGLRVPGGGASCLGVGRLGSGALPLPTARPLGGLPGPTTQWLWVRGGAGVGTRHQPHSANSCELALRAVGAARGRPGGAPPAWVWGVRGRALSRLRLPALWAGCWGLLPTGCGYGGLRACGPVPDPTARALASWLCALWGRHEGARGGRLLPGCGASRVGRSLTPGCPPSGGAAGAYYPLAVGAGGCGRGDPSPTPQRALLRAGFARCGGGTRAPGGGASCLGVGRPGSGALPSPTARPLSRLPGPTTHRLWVRGGAGMGTRHQPHSARSCVLWGRLEGARGGRLLPACGATGLGRSPTPDCPPSGWAAGGPLPTGCGCAGVRAWGPVTNPTARALACCRGGLRVPGGGASCLGVGRPGLGALPPPTARPLGGLPGPTTHWLWVRGVRAWGPVTNPTARALACCGDGLRVPWGAPLACVWGVRGWALSHPRPPALWVGCRGPLPTGCGCGGVRAWGPVTNPTARALASWLCALWGWHGGARGGRLLPACGASGVGRSPDPDCPPCGRAAGAHYPLAVGTGGCRRGDPSRTPQRALLPAGFARCGGGMRVPGGGASCLGVGRPGLGALSPPAARPLGGLPGPTTHWLWVRGGAGVGTRHQPHSARSCELALRAVGEARGRPGGAPPAWVWGVRGRALSHPRLPALWAGCRCPLPTGCGCGGVRAWGPVNNPTARALACCGGGLRVPGGGDSCLRVGRPGSGALPPPTARPLGGLPGAH